MRTWALLFTLLVSFPARGELAGLDADLDGDGAVERIVLEANGRVVTSGNRHAPLSTELVPRQGVNPLGEGARMGFHPIDGHRLILVRNLDKEHEGAWLLEVVGGRLQVVWSDLLGVQGADAEWKRGIHVDERGLWLFEERPGSTRCGGGRAWLNPRRYDVKSRRFLPYPLDSDSPKEAPVLMATRTPPEGFSETTGNSVYSFQAASTQAGDGGSAGGLSPPREIDDGNNGTAWLEEKDGFGKGEFLTAQAGVPEAQLVALRIMPGDASSKASFKSRNRLKRVFVEASGARFAVHFASDPDQATYWVVFPSPIPTRCVTVTIDEVYQGTEARASRHMGTTAISELVALSDLDRDGEQALAALAEAVARGGKKGESAERVLARRGTGTASVLSAMARKDRSAQERRALQLALARIGDATAAGHLASALREASAPDDPLAASLVSGLKRLGDGAIPALAELLGDEKAPTWAQEQAASMLGELRHDAALRALLSRLGTGPVSLRKAIARAITGHGPPALPMVLATWTESAQGPLARRADLMRLLGLLSPHASPEESEDTARVVAAEMAHAKEYELRYRVVQAAAALIRLPAMQSLVMQVVTDRSSDPALRKAVLEELLRSPGNTPAAHPEIGRIFQAAAADADPGVRVAATEGLADRAIASADDVLLERLSKDRWPVVRWTAALALANRCASRPAADGLYVAVQHDPEPRVKRVALDALVACREPRVGGRLVAIVGQAQLSVPLRTHAAELLGVLENPNQVPDMIGLLAAVRLQAKERPAVSRVAAALARSLGKAGDRRAEPALLEMLQDKASPQARAAAATALGALCTPYSLQALSEASSADDPHVARAARLSLAHCGK
ncbi:MAG: HEAT repeat domain-containing protein [Deltaproteobacteria bacterium]|nr:HEAT repeat domain-containing protein [Deltaproteobacteria bacterium]